ncbi:MAG: hypothetical protein U9N79_04980 [Actinomycetota bacterium]|nr:hypothetical protein [Actinomycetota bacterium]
MIALFWIGLLSVLADESNIVVTIGGALLVTVLPAFVGFALLGAGIDQEQGSSLDPEPESRPRRSGFLRFVGWIILALTAIAWIVLVLALIDDPSGILGIILGGLVISVIPGFVALMFITDGDALAVEEQDDTSVD